MIELVFRVLNRALQPIVEVKMILDALTLLKLAVPENVVKLDILLTYRLLMFADNALRAKVDMLDVNILLKKAFDAYRKAVEIVEAVMLETVRF